MGYYADLLNIGVGIESVDKEYVQGEELEHDKSASARVDKGEVNRRTVITELLPDPSFFRYLEQGGGRAPNV